MDDLLPRRYQLLVFDWDGTLADSTAIIVDAMRAACADAGVAVPSVNEARHVIGLGLDDVLSLIAPGIAPGARTVLVDSYRRNYFMRDGSITLYAGAAALLDELAMAGYLVALATGKSRAGLDRALALAGLDRRFDATRCADEGFAKPHPGMLLHVMETLVTVPARTLMIGDTTHDLDLAGNAGVDGLAVTHGAHEQAALATRSPSGIVDSIAALRAWLVLNG